MDEAEKIATKVVMGTADLEFIRVLEDVIDLLCRKGVISLDELPPQAAEKIRQRRTLRET